MIKEKKKITKYNYKKSAKEIAIEYLRTIAISVLFSLIFTIILAFNARAEMIKNLYNDENIKQKLDMQMAQKIIAQSNLLTDLNNKSYTMCMHIGELYETAEDYRNAQIAYEFAILKAKKGFYKPYLKLVTVLVAQENFEDAESLLENLTDHTDKNLIKIKTRSYIIMGDKYYSIGKFLSAAKSYEQAGFYYNKFIKKDKVVDKAIKTRIVNAYIQAADIMVKSGMNSEAARFLKKAETYENDNYTLKYKLAIILSESDPEKSVDYFEPLLEKMPQDIDYEVYNSALVKAANIADLDNRPTVAKRYRYKIHSIDMFIKRKVVYKNDIETEIQAFSANKILFKYPLKAIYSFKNVSNSDILNLQGDFVLCKKGNPVETITEVIANKNKPMLISENTPNEVTVKFKKNIFTRKELEDYTIKIYLYKDDKYKTLVFETTIPKKNFNLKKEKASH